MKSSRIDIASIRKEQIVEAAVAVITEQGLHNLSLSEIETKAGMKRGQLTYYFKHKEDILLAVFDRVLQLTYQRLGVPADAQAGPGGERSSWKIICYLMEALLTKPPVSPEFHCLQYTFLSQIGYREDFRQRLATLYNEWRTNMAEGLSADLARRPGLPKVSPRTLASLIQGMLHGLSMQLAADPSAFDGREMIDLCLDLLGNYLGIAQPATRKAAAKSKHGSSGSKRGQAPFVRSTLRAVPANGA
jgi:TetR/AcrR family transcriptional regulator, transcriptional repressor of bet genes